MIQFIPVHNDLGKLLGVKVELNEDQSLSFRTGGYSNRKAINNAECYFDALNDLLSNLVPEDAEAMFSEFVSIHNLAEQSGNTVFNSLRLDLIDIIARIFDIVSFDGIDAWAVNAYRGFAIPPTIETPATRSNYPNNSTYSARELRQLYGLSTALKLLTPIFGEFWTDFKAEYTNTFKCYGLLNLFRRETLENVEPFMKLLTMVTDKVKRSDGMTIPPMGLMLDGNLGEAEYPWFIVAYILITVVGPSETDLEYINEATKQVNNIPSKINNSTSNMINTDFKKHRIGELDNVAQNNKTGGNLTIQEDVKSIQKMSDTWVVYFNHTINASALYNIYPVRGQTKEAFLKEHKRLFGIFLPFVNKSNPTLGKGKLTLLKPILQFSLQSQAFETTTREGTNLAVAMAAAQLHQMGHYVLVNYLLAIEDPEPDLGAISLMRSQMKDRRVGRDVIEKLDQYYDRDSCDKNPMERWVTKEVVPQTAEYSWLKNTPKQLNDEYGQKEIWVVGVDFKLSLYSLLITIAEMVEDHRYLDKDEWDTLISSTVTP